MVRIQQVTAIRRQHDVIVVHLADRDLTELLEIGRVEELDLALALHTDCHLGAVRADRHAIGARPDLEASDLLHLLQIDDGDGIASRVHDEDALGCDLDGLGPQRRQKRQGEGGPQRNEPGECHRAPPGTKSDPRLGAILTRRGGEDGAPGHERRRLP